MAVIGAGIMGRGIALGYAMNGHKVALYDACPTTLRKAKPLIKTDLQLLNAEDLASDDQCRQALDNIFVVDSLAAAVASAGLITEAVPEQLELKWQVFAEIEALAPNEAIIASNTSTLPLGELSKHLAQPERMMITHFFNPAHLVPLVEVVKSEHTPEQTVTTTLNLLRQAGKTPIVLKREVPGFIANRLQAALLREALHLVNEGVAEAADLDTALTAGPGFRWAAIGPLETADFGGLDTWKSVMNNLTPELDCTQGVPPAIEDLYRQGHLGVKTGQGFYPYPTEKIVAEKIKARDLNFIRLLKLWTDSRKAVEP
jgi:3-hydroxyacyl-CoA dehydrogenase